MLAAGDVDTSIDPVALNYYMSFHAVVPPPHTILNGIRKIEPGTVVTFEPDGRRTDHRFWTMTFGRSAAEAKRSSEDWRDAVHDRCARRWTGAWWPMCRSAFCCRAGWIPA